MQDGVVFEGKGQVCAASNQTYRVLFREYPLLGERFSFVVGKLLFGNSYIFLICIIMVNCHRKGP